MSTGRAAHVLGHPRSTLKFWINKYGWEPDDTTVGGDPLWDPERLRGLIAEEKRKAAEAARRRRGEN